MIVTKFDILLIGFITYCGVLSESDMYTKKEVKKQLLDVTVMIIIALLIKNIFFG